jgi:L-fuconolactonase
MSLRIDAHHHLWQVARGDYGWLSGEPVAPITRDFNADELRPLLAAAGVDRTVLVQAAESIAETEFLLDIAAREDFVAGVVGWVDFDSEDALEQIGRLSRDTKLVGLRPMLQDMADDRWLLREEHDAVLRALQRRGLCFDALIKPRHLPVIAELAQRHPDLPIVIDHGAKPDIARRGFAQWAAAIKPFKSLSHVHCKLSGLATEAGPDWNTAVLQPYVDLMLEVFGPDRVMWGSDWPVLLLAGGYLQWLEVAEQLTCQLTQDERTRIFGTTAARFYGIADA